MSNQAPAPPRAFGSGAGQSFESLLAAPLPAPRPALLRAPLTALEGVGPAAARNAAKLGMASVGDLLDHLPFDHRDYERTRTVSERAIGEEATVSVRGRNWRVRPARRR